MRTRTKLVGTLALLAAGAVPAVHATANAAAPTVYVFNGEGNRLNVYDAATGEKQTLIWSASDPDVGDGREHRDLNAQICFTEHDGATYFIAGEDTAQGGEEGDPGWGWFELEGDSLHELRTTQRGKLVPTYGNAADNPENYGCGFLDDGRLVTTDVGDQLPGAAPNGQLIVWFPDPDGGFDEGFHLSENGVPQASTVDYCKIDTGLATAGGIYVDRGATADPADDVVYAASARPPNGVTGQWGIFRYKGIGAMDDCADAAAVTKELFIAAGPLSLTPSGIAPSGRGTWYVSSVFDGNIGEYSASGTFIRHVAGTPGVLPVSAPIGQVARLAPKPVPSAGTPFGIGVAPDGTIWFAEIGVVGPGPVRPGHVMKVRFNALGLPQPAQIVDSGLAFPDGIGILVR